jgi:hypothetical protein
MDSGLGQENAEAPANSMVLENQNSPTPGTPLSPLPAEQPQLSPEKDKEEDKEEKNILFDTVTTLNKQFMTLHAVLLFSGHSNPCMMSTLASYHAQFQACQNQKKSTATGSTTPHSQAAAI